MAISSPTIVLRQSSSAELRTAGAAINAAIAAVGLVQTSDTGQINWTTVVANTTTSTNLGFEIWRCSDALQSTKPIFMKVTYLAGGANGNSVDTLAFAFQLGTATNGAGTILGTATSSLVGGASNSTATALQCYFGGDGTYFWCLLGARNSPFSNSDTGPIYFFCFDRTRDASGAVTGLGAVVFRTFYNSTSYGLGQGVNALPVDSNYGGTSQPLTNWREDYLLFDRQLVQSRNNYSCAFVPGDMFTTGLNGTDTSVYPMLVQGGPLDYVNVLVVGFTGDFTFASTITATVLGTSHTYIPLKISPTGFSTHTMLMRYE